MARKSAKTVAMQDLEQLSHYAELSEDDKLRKIRELECKLASARTAAKDTDTKRQQAESDLRQSENMLERLLAVQDRASLRKLESNRRTRGRASAIICANDWHCEEKVDGSMIDGLNEFNLKIAEKRIGRVWTKSSYMIDFARSISDVREVVLWLGGDLINGYIHAENQESNFLGPTEAVLFMQDHIHTGIQHLLKDKRVERLVVVANYGNHGRATDKRRISTGFKTSWEWLAYNTVARYYQDNPRVLFKIAKGYHALLDVQGYNVRFHHGDSVKFGGGIGGVHIPLRKKIAQWNKAGTPAHLDILGHFHQFADDWRYVLCGCLVGYNAYAVDIGAEYQPPTQTFVVVDRTYGKVLALPLFVEK